VAGAAQPADANRAFRLPYRRLLPLPAYQGGDEFGFHGSFHEVRPSELIVQTFTFEGEPDGVALERIMFTDLGDGRTRLTATSLVDSFAARDAFIASGMEVGIREGYERLDEVLVS
jgi:uncharacterized protein YndB with AHSA1/START domain